MCLHSQSFPVESIVHWADELLRFIACQTSLEDGPNGKMTYLTAGPLYHARNWKSRMHCQGPVFG